MTEHTPGPWEMCNPTGDNKLGDPICIHTASRGGIAEVWQILMSNSDQVEEKANARLIAAAPDLLEAAQFTLDLLQNLSTGDFSLGEDKPARTKLQVAIEKATGND